MLFRHGDVLIQKVKLIPKSIRRLPHATLAHGEVTGHSHTIAEPENIALFEDGDRTIYLRVTKTATLRHQEHGPIELPPGEYKVWRQREYSPREIRVVRD